jgi:prepilin-type N-terminal cleavage/methylation domain-containing protein
MQTNTNYRAFRSGVAPLNAAQHRAAGFSMVEVLVVLAVVLIIASASIPVITTTLASMHLGSAASSLSGAIQAARYQAISVGCPFTITVNASPANSYQLQTEAISGNPPACATTYTNLAPPFDRPVSFANADVTIPATTTIVLNPGGTISALATPTIPGSFSIVLAHGATTKTVTVTGVGNVKVTSP